MIVRDSEIKMPTSRLLSRIDTLELKARIIKKLGHHKSEKYFYLLGKLLSLKIRKSEFTKACISVIGRENLPLHNQFIGSIVKNACAAKAAPPSRGSRVEGGVNGRIGNGCRRSGSQSPASGDMFPMFPCQGRSSNLREHKIRDRLSPLGPNGKIQSIEQQSATEVVSLGSRPPAEVVSVEDGEEVEQMMGSPSVQSRSPVRPPLGIPTNMGGGARKALRNNLLTSFRPEMCRNCYELPDTRSLRKRLERKLEMEGLSISMDCVNLLNNGLDVFIKQLIKPCIELAAAKRGVEHPNLVKGRFRPGLNEVISASLLDFRVAMEINPQLLGDDWPFQLEKVCLRASED